MERLTKRNEADSAYYYPKCFENCGGIGASSKCENCELTYNVCEKLGNYEDLEEQGRLMRLPCKPGSEVFLICSRYTHCGFEDVPFEESSCVGCEHACDSRKEFYIHRNSSVDIEWITRNLNKFGETVFLTKSEAEAKLAEMKKNESEE